MSKTARGKGPVHYTVRYADTWRIAVSKGYDPDAVWSAPPDPKVKAAFEAFAGRFCRSLDDQEKPWKFHEKHARSRHKIPAAREWPLGWYWQLALPALRDQNPVKNSEFTIRLSQVGQYTLLCVLEQAGDGERLLCPPVFGSGERLSRGDQYLLYTAIFREDIGREYDRIKGLGCDARAEKEELAFLLGRHDVHYGIRVEKAGADQFEVSVKGRFDPHPFLRYLDNRTLAPRKPGGDARTSLCVHNPYRVVQIPRFANADSQREPVEILLASDAVCSAMTRLSEVWNDPTCQSVLLIAAPGSGKALYARSLYDFRDYRKRGRFCAVTLTENVDRNATVLFAVPGEVHCKHCADRQDDVGAAVRASDGVLFVDEVDKVEHERSKEVLSPLLRLLEAEEFIAPGTARVVSFRSLGARPPLYVFAASRPADEVRAMKPQDFWTRISHEIEVDHPLRAERTTRRKILVDYVTLFWNQHVPKLLKERGFRASAAEGREKGAFRKYYPAIAGLLLDADVVRSMADCVVEVLEAYSAALAKPGRVARKNAPLSVRDVRSLTRRCVFQVVQLALGNEWIATTARRLEYERALKKAEVTSVFEWVRIKLEDPAFLEETRNALKETILGAVPGGGRPGRKNSGKATPRPARRKAR